MHESDSAVSIQAAAAAAAADSDVYRDVNLGYSVNSNVDRIIIFLIELYCLAGLGLGFPCIGGKVSVCT